MKIGDMVIRSYAWSSIVPGIIVEERWAKEKVEHREDIDIDYTNIVFTVMWSDGLQTSEMAEELFLLEDVIAS